jgi:N-acetylglutamate synthase-like GNAT family acetyltransferase
LWANSITFKHSENTNINLFFNRNFSDDYFFNRIYFDNENDIVISLKFLKKFLTLEGISGYLHLKNDTCYLKKQFKKNKVIFVDSIYTLESPTELITTTSLNLEKEISVTKINDTVLLKTWTSIFCQSFNIKDHGPFMEIINKNKQKFVFLLAMLKNRYKKKKKNENISTYNRGNNNDNDNIPAGVCLLYENSGCLGLYCLGTLPEFRSRGIAQMILKTSLQIAYTLKYDKIFLQTFQNDNYVDFYKKFKFKVIDKRKIFQITN